MRAVAAHLTQLAKEFEARIKTARPKGRKTGKSPKSDDQAKPKPKRLGDT